MSKYKEALNVEQILNELLKIESVKEEVEVLRNFLAPIIANEKEKEFKRERDIKTSWNSFIPNREVTKLSTVLSTASKLYEEAREEVSKYDRETQDILHSLELTDLDDEEYAAQWKDMQKLRIYRRKAKNFVEAVEPIHNFAKENPTLIKQLGKLHGEVTKVNQSIQNRKYYPRVRTNLQEAFDKADHIYERMERLKLVNN